MIPQTPHLERRDTVQTEQGRVGTPFAWVDLRVLDVTYHNVGTKDVD